jgi:hypothetical protein
MELNIKRGEREVRERGRHSDGCLGWREARAMKREKREIEFNFRVGLIFYSGGVDFKYVCHVIS